MRSSNSNKSGVRDQLDRAIKLHGVGKSRQAAKKLETMALAHRDSAAVAGMLGSVYFELDEPEKAARWFRRATELSPKSELASVGLFHSLWELNEATAAVAEMRRFLRLADSGEYSKLLRDLAVEGRLVPHTAGAA